MWHSEFYLVLNQFLLEYSCSTLLCQFLLPSTRNRPYFTQIASLLDFFPIAITTVHYRVLCALQYVLISYLFYIQYQQYICVNPNLPPPPNPLPPGIHIFILQVCVSLFAFAKWHTEFETFMLVICLRFKGKPKVCGRVNRINK